MLGNLAFRTKAAGTVTPTRFLPLAAHSLDIAFQPIVEASSGRLYGFESLMRGHEQLGFAAPPGLLDHAHDHDDLLQVEQVLGQKAIAKLAAFSECADKTLFLNLDSRSIPRGSAFVDTLLSALDSFGLQPSALCLELSERFDNASYAQFPALMERLHRTGFKIAIDDFGVGNAELKLLSEFHVDFIKIDRHFVSQVDSNPRKRQVFRTLVSMAHQFGITVIAEGVETEAEFRLCTELGADMLQGWFIARPTVDIENSTTDFAHLQAADSDRWQSRSIDEFLVRKKIEQPPYLYEHDSIDRVFELFRQNPGQYYLPVLNLNSEPRGVITERRVKELVYQPFGRDLLKNQSYKRTVMQYVEHAPIVSLNTRAERMMELFATMSGSECIIMTDNMRYAGVISAASLLHVINEKQLKAARDQNPLTLLPGNRQISEFIDSAAQPSSSDRFFCYCDFDHFKPFNDSYGFHMGDHAICLFAAMMRRYFLLKTDFLGHIGGDDFFIGVTDRSEAELQAILARLLKDFNEEIAKLYSPEDRASGQMQGTDRSGTRKYFPLIRCSIGVVVLRANESVEDHASIGASIAGLKSLAKAHERGLVFANHADLHPRPAVI